MIRVESFIEALAAMGLKDVFNPYTDRCEIHDKPNAPALRRKNLRAFLKAASTRPIDSIWIFRSARMSHLNYIVVAGITQRGGNDALGGGSP